jgi:hypothetical protein
MPRALTVARVRVAVAQQPEYLAVLSELEAIGRARGRHLWVFRSGADPDLFLECSESGTVEDHRAVVSAEGREAALERRLRELAPRDPSADALWHESPLPVLPT